ncbi:predicted protein [Naegleria gruberi]|uniref:Predicted protein n=1 Tax=Naegleria gruberi TaxID=5762 RepID=D2VPY7_NAEGR|nr:uncharacterized protein NAEGRDRAFT_71101 [Naegleria gruberi]EFC41013.1 predicted protein [Naegleria gruberi]|eukprot:XP_002673757.1 predicted protein [Naegleria gruberi strain NEG-M]
MKRTTTQESSEEALSEQSSSKKLKLDQNCQLGLYSLHSDIKLYILEFIQFFLSRHLIVSEFDEHSLELEHVDVSSKEKLWEHTKVMARRQLLKLMFGYFVDESRRIHLLFKHVNFCASGIFHQHELFTELRFRDLKSIEYSRNYLFSSKYFDFKEYLPRLEAVWGLNIEVEEDAKSFLAHDLSRMKSVSFGYLEKDVCVPESIGFETFFSKLTNLTTLELSCGYIDEEFVFALMKSVKHLRKATFTEATLNNDALQMLLEQAEFLEELDVSMPNDSFDLDYIFDRVKRPLKLTKLFAESNDVTEKFFVNIVKAAKYLGNLKVLSISPYMINDEELWKNLFNSFPQLTELELSDQTLTESIMSHIHVLKELRSLKSNLETTKGLELLLHFKSLTLSCLTRETNLDFSKLNHLEFLAIDALYNTILDNFDKDESLPKLKRVKLYLINDVERTIDEVKQIAEKRPEIRFSLILHEGVTPVDIFERILSCKGIDELDSFNAKIPDAIETNSTLKSLTILNAKSLANLELLQNNKTLEVLNLYSADIFEGEYVSEICNLFRNSQAEHISLIDPSIVGEP